jgi:hypothetical protein
VDLHQGHRGQALRVAAKTRPALKLNEGGDNAISEAILFRSRPQCLHKRASGLMNSAQKGHFLVLPSLCSPEDKAFASATL